MTKTAGEDHQPSVAVDTPVASSEASSGAATVVETAATTTEKAVAVVVVAEPTETEAAAAAVVRGTEEQQEETKEVNEKKEEKREEKKTPAKRGRKRKAVSEADAKPDGEAGNDDETESESEAPATKPGRRKPGPKKRGKTAAKGKQAPAKPPAKRGRKKKVVVVSESDTDDEEREQREVERRVEELPEDVKAQFGKIVWVKMAGYPYWPALLTDPRHLPRKLQQTAMKDLGTKHLSCFYRTMNYAAILFKNIEPWDDTKFPYREGHPVKDAKAPKRRTQLMEAIEIADKEIALPIEKRMDGLVAPLEDTDDEEDEDEKEEEPQKEVVPVKRKVGRPLGSKNKKPSKAQRGRKKAEPVVVKDDGEETETETRAAHGVSSGVIEEEDEATKPSLSKEEIKAKVSNRKSPSKKKSAQDEKSSAAGKKVNKVTKVSTSKSEKTSKSVTEVDSKRKKEIELVVPRKSVKSADIREATEEAARKKLNGGKDKPKDKGNYVVGNLHQFSRKMTRLQANESSKNNDELIQMLTQLLEEKEVYRSDVEHSGLAAIIALLRKSMNPTVAQTASAVRKHMMNVLINDIPGEAVPSKKHKSDSANGGKQAKKQKTAMTSTTGAKKESETSPVNGKDATPNVSPQEPERSPVRDAKPVSPTLLATADEGGKQDTENQQSSTNTAESSPETSAPAAVAGGKKEAGTVASPMKKKEKTIPVLPSTKPKSDPSTDTNRVACIELLSKALESNGVDGRRIAKEIEESVFDRFAECGDEYRSAARTITFGLKKNATVRERLFNGSLHALELAYATNEFFN